ncbi:MAG: trimeric intracellular cation channel family protein [Bdellovibrionota bacterium]
MVTLSFDVMLDFIGAFAFCLSGASVGSRHRMDFFGVFIMAVVTGFGGGCLRDIILGNNLPFLFRTPIYWIIACVATLIIFIPLSHKIVLRRITVNIFDAAGLAFFTVVGIKAGLANNLEAYQCIIMGVLTACFGGVLRDIIVNQIPHLFQREIYASISIVGGVLFFLLKPLVDSIYLEFLIIGFIFISRIFVMRFDLHLPKPKTRNKRSV